MGYIGGMKALVLVSFLLFCTSCQIAQTRVTESHQTGYTQLIAKTSQPLVVTDQTLIIDARSRFDYELSHISGSIHLAPTDFNQKEDKHKIREDLRGMIRRLAKYGLDSWTPVVVVDQGQLGRGAAGRIAFVLFYMGVKNVQIADIETLRKNINLRNRPRLKSVSAWDPVYKKELFVNDLSVFLGQGSHRKQIYVGQKVYLKNSALELPFRSFINKEGRPYKAIEKILKQNGIHKNDEIVLVGPHSTVSAAAALSLLSLGYKAYVFNGVLNQ